MRSKVFVSCGQHNKEERQLASSIAGLLERKGFEPYVAIEVQTVFEINSRLLRHLKDSDCYLFVNFRREQLGDGSCRGSLFSHQEFAIAYALGFENILVVNQCGVAREGMLGCLASNTDEFENLDDCLAVVDRAIGRAGWLNTYSRRLTASGLRFSEDLISYGQLVGHFLYIDIHNQRSDIAALEMTGRLSAYSEKGMPFQPSGVRSPLKATGRPGFSHTVFPSSYEAFDLLCLGWWLPQAALEGNVQSTNATTAIAERHQMLQMEVADRRVYLNTALDVRPLASLPITQGEWLLKSEFFAIDFPLLSVAIELKIGAGAPPSARLTDLDAAT